MSEVVASLDRMLEHWCIAGQNSGISVDGIIDNALARYKARKTVHIDGIAASAASVIAMAGHEIVMPDNALMMIHEPTQPSPADAWGKVISAKFPKAAG